MATLVPKILHQDAESVIWRFNRILDSEQEREVKAAILGEFKSSSRTAVTVLPVNRSSTIVVARIMDSF